MPKIYINASDVAAAVGLNRWKSPEQLVTQLREKETLSVREVAAKDFVLTPDEHSKIIGATGTREDADRLMLLQIESEKRVTTIRKELDNVSHTYDIKNKLIVEEIALLSQSDNRDKHRKIETLHEKRVILSAESACEKKQAETKIRAVENEMRTEQALLTKKVLTKALEPAIVGESPSVSLELEKKTVAVLPDVIQNNARQIVNTQRGIRRENDIIGQLENETQRRVTRRNDKLHYLELCVTSSDSLLIGGRIDGFSEEEGKLVEVKHRRNRFLGFPKYEKVQCEVYMHMLGVTECVHSEMFCGELRNHEYTSNQAFWTEIIEGLENFKELFYSVL